MDGWVWLVPASALACWLLWRAWTRPYAEFGDTRRREEALRRIGGWETIPLDPVEPSVKVVPPGE